MGKTPIHKEDGKEWYKIDFPKEDQLEYLKIPVYNDIFEDNHMADIILKNNDRKYLWDKAIDYRDLVTKL
jgi:hypothetical protein